jgi:hypothetical protein
MDDYGKDFARRVNKGMRTLQAVGFFAPNKAWQCCTGCAFGAIPDDEARPVVFYHEQNRECFEDGETHLGYDPNTEKSGLSNEEVLLIMRRVFNQVGLSWEHNGDQARKPKVSRERSTAS